MPIPMKTGLLKPYNIVVNEDDNSAEINMYGEVVSTRPVDWWTGEPIPGNFIAQDEFLKDLDKLAGKDRITVHINSVGGDMYAGIAIYNRLKALAGHVTTVNDGLAASAGSLIFMAGDTRKVNTGSNLMIHGAAGFLYGYYQTQDLRAVAKQLDAHNKAGINIYVEATGKDKDTIKAMVDRETWLTGQEAVDAGFADEVITGEEKPVEMRLSPDKATMIVNGYPVAARCIGNIPESVPVMSADEWAEVSATAGGEEPPKNSAQPAPQVCDKTTNKNGGTNTVEIKNVEDLRKAHPELVSQIENEARNAGIVAERQRIQGIEEMQAAVADSAMVQNAKYGENPMSAEAFAVAVLKQQAAIGATVLQQMQNDAGASGAADVTADPNGGTATVVDEAAEAQKQIDEAVKNFNLMNGGKK